jgi:hypothetical protein
MDDWMELSDNRAPLSSLRGQCMASLEGELRKALLTEWGYVMGSEGLRQAFGFRSQAALRAAISHGHVPVRTFTIVGRRGPYALTHEVAAWLTSQINNTEPSVSAPPKESSTKTPKEAP